MGCTVLAPLVCLWRGQIAQMKTYVDKIYDDRVCILDFGLTKHVIQHFLVAFSCPSTPTHPTSVWASWEVMLGRLRGFPRAIRAYKRVYIVFERALSCTWETTILESRHCMSGAQLLAHSIWRPASWRRYFSCEGHVIVMAK